jgi:hypothetical protein
MTIEKSDGFTAVKTFSVTLMRDRGTLGERVTEWISAHARVRIVDYVIVQSSCDDFHCLSIVLFYAD